jgi:hypothetical protein
MKTMRNWLLHRREGGQTLVLFTFFLVVLILFIGLGIDMGFAYITRANLSKACDAAVLAGIDNFWQGIPTATAIATNAFSVNYGKTGRDVVPPVPSVSFTTDASNNTTLTVTASTSIRTFFIRILPQWKTLTVGNASSSIRAHVVISLVLDKSGSMSTTCRGGTLTRLTYLQQSVTNFINYFNDTVDRMGMASFDSCSSNDVPIQVPFKVKIRDATLALQTKNGFTASSSGMAEGWSQIQKLIIPSGEITRTGMVFFTDGYANTFSNNFTCGSKTNAIRNINDGKVTYDPNNGCGTTTCSVPSSIPSAYPAYTGLTTINTGNSQQMDLEAEARTVLWANQARSAGAFVYAIGLNCDTEGPKSNFLAHVANVNGVEDPSGQNTPWGISIIAPTGEQLRDAFQTIAKAILLRLTQ